METDKLIIEEFDLSRSVAKSMIIERIDKEINQCKLDYLSQWMRDHSTSSELKDKKIQELEAKKAEIQNLFSKVVSDDSSVDISLSIKVKNAGNHQEKALQYAS